MARMRMRGPARALVALLLALATVGRAASAQAPADEAQVKAAFVYNFLKFIDWPADAFIGQRDSLIVGIVGSGPTADATARFLDGKPVNGRAVAIRRMTGEDKVPTVHALFIGKVDLLQTRRILDGVGNSATLTIGESADFVLQGGAIGLLVDDQKVRFEINTNAASVARLKVSSKLLALARRLYPRTMNRSTPR